MIIHQAIHHLLKNISNNAHFLIFSFCLFFATIVAAYPLSLPRSLQGKPVYYDHSDQIPNWSCGYNVLYNACTIEKRFGFVQPNADLALFKLICKPYIERLGKKSDEASSNKMLDDLARRLRLQPFTYLYINDKGMVEYLSSDSVKISYPQGSSKAHIDRLFEQARKKMSDERMKYLKTHIHAYGNCAIAHFACKVVSRGVDHAVLMSVIKEGMQTKLYIYDNMNANISEYSDTKQHIDFLMNEFMIAGGNIVRKPATIVDRIDYNAQRVLRNKTVQNIVRGLNRVFRYSRFLRF